MNQRGAVKERGALYYPYIHIRDEAWLKSTMLCFPYLERMVPDGYEVNDGTLARELSASRSLDVKPLLRRRSLEDRFVERAQAIILGKLREDLMREGPAFLSRFDRAAAERDERFDDGANAFQIHADKLAENLLATLRREGLAWDPSRPVRGNARWWAVHPVLGEAIISTNAVALSEGHDLEIVTSSGVLHEALLSDKADTVYDVVVRNSAVPQARPDNVKVNDLMRFVIYSEFDLGDVGPDEIRELKAQRADISALKSELATLLDDVGRVPDTEVWKDTLEQRAKEVVAAWQARQPSFKGFLRGFKGSDLAAKGESHAKEVVKEALKATGSVATATAITTSVAGALPALLVGVAFYAGTVAYREISKPRTSPYRFLSALVKRGAVQSAPGHLLSIDPGQPPLPPGT